MATTVYEREIGVDDQSTTDFFAVIISFFVMAIDLFIFELRGENIKKSFFQ